MEARTRAQEYALLVCWCTLAVRGRGKTVSTVLPFGGSSGVGRNVD